MQILKPGLLPAQSVPLRKLISLFLFSDGVSQTADRVLLFTLFSLDRRAHLSYTVTQRANSFSHRGRVAIGLEKGICSFFIIQNKLFFAFDLILYPLRRMLDSVHTLNCIDMLSISVLDFISALCYIPLEDTFRLGYMYPLPDFVFTKSSRRDGVFFYVLDVVQILFAIRRIDNNKGAVIRICLFLFPAVFR